MPLRVERAFRRAQRRGEQVRPLAIVPAAMIAPDRVMMGDRAAGGDQRVARRALDRPPLLDQRAMPAERVEREIGRGPVGIDMGEAAGDFALDAGRLENGALGRGLDRVVERFEALPGDRGLERVVDDPGRRQKFARIGHADEGVAPEARGAFAMRVDAAGLGDAAVVGATFERALHPGVERMVARFEGEHHDRDRAVGGAGVVGLRGIEDAAVRRDRGRLARWRAPRARQRRSYRTSREPPARNVGFDCNRIQACEMTPRMPSEPMNMRSGLGPAPDPGRRRVSITPCGVTTRRLSTRSSIWV